MTEIKVGTRVIAKCREWPDVFVFGPIKEITTGPLYRDGIKVVDDKIVLYLVEAERKISIRTCCIINGTLTPDIVFGTVELWEALEEDCRQITDRFQMIDTFFKKYSCAQTKKDKGGVKA